MASRSLMEGLPVNDAGSSKGRAMVRRFCAWVNRARNPVPRETCLKNSVLLYQTPSRLALIEAPICVVVLGYTELTPDIHWGLVLPTVFALALWVTVGYLQSIRVTSDGFR
jgi:hypothetical protein